MSQDITSIGQENIVQEQPMVLNKQESSGKPYEVVLFNKFKVNLFVVLGIIFGFVFVFAGYAIFMSKNSGNIISPIGRFKDDIFQGEMTMNPLTGEMVPSSDWIVRRPMAVMINNYLDARMQSGLAASDLTYEIVAEGGITRFLAFFLSENPEKIGPVRSARHYYLVLVKELGDAMIMHIGWSPQALEAIETWPVRSLQRGGGQFWRDQDRISAGVASEHTAYVNGIELRGLADDLGWSGMGEFTSWKFKKDTPAGNTIEGEDELSLVGLNKPIIIDFWYEGDYSAIWNYDPDTNTYLRFTGYDPDGNPIPHVDQETNEQIRVKNLIIQFAEENAIVDDDKNRLDYVIVGSNEALVFIDGLAINATWSKAGRDDRTMFYDGNGNEMEFNRGKFWISIVPDRNKDQVNY
jgi:hypothetical protein